jgi:hypothetical protein
VSRIWVTLGGMPRCVKCCEHGVALSRIFCPWCDDISDGMYDCIAGPDEPQWLCAHGIGIEPGNSEDDFLACLRGAKP